MIKSLLTISLILFSLPSYAMDFKCLVIDSVKLEKNGKLSKTNKIAIKAIGKEFTVNRLTGIISGASFVNNMSGVAPTVYNYSKSEGNSYSAITIYKPNYTIDYLTINEWVNNLKKTFIYKEAWGELVSGLCEYY